MEAKKTLAAISAEITYTKKKVTVDTKTIIWTEMHPEITRGEGRELEAQITHNYCCRLYAA